LARWRCPLRLARMRWGVPASHTADAHWKCLLRLMSVRSDASEMCKCALACWKCPLRIVRLRSGALDVSASLSADARLRAGLEAAASLRMLWVRSGALEVSAFALCGCALARWRCPVRRVRMPEVSASPSADALWRVGRVRFADCGCALARWKCPLR
jgi:hypothetical protein